MSLVARIPFAYSRVYMLWRDSDRCGAADGTLIYIPHRWIKLAGDSKK